MLAGAVSVAFALASLLAPSGPTYDPYSWLIWGRDLAHLSLVTSNGGTAWKPLPSLIAAPLTPLGATGAADGWLVVARAGAIFGVFMAFRLAWRLSPRGARPLAALVAAAAVVITPQYFERNAVGNAEGLMAACFLLGVDRHLDGHRKQAFALFVAAGLIRVEVWPVIGIYGAWLWWRDPQTRAVVAAGALAIPLLWFGGDWLGSGSLTTAATRAQHAVRGAPGAGPHPALSVVREAYHMLPFVAWPLMAVALLLVRARRAILAAMLAAAALWTLVTAVMAEHGYAGLPRFLYGAVGLEAVAAGVGAGALVVAAGQAVNALTRRTAPEVGSVGLPRIGLTAPAATTARFGPAARIGSAAGATAIAVVFALGAVPNAKLLPSDAKSVDRIADTDAKLVNEIQAAGGPRAVLSCGRPRTAWWTVSALSYDLNVDLGGVRMSPHAHVAYVGSCATTARLRALRGGGASGSRAHGRS